MADTTVNRLFPPRVDTFQPAFLYQAEDGVSIVFSISPFNTKNEIKKIHVSITDQKNNQNALKPSLSLEGKK